MIMETLFIVLAAALWVWYVSRRASAQEEESHRRAVITKLVQRNAELEETVQERTEELMHRTMTLSISRDDVKFLTARAQTLMSDGNEYRRVIHRLTGQDECISAQCHALKQDNQELTDRCNALERDLHQRVNACIVSSANEAKLLTEVVMLAAELNSANGPAPKTLKGELQYLWEQADRAQSRDLEQWWALVEKDNDLKNQEEEIKRLKMNNALLRTQVAELEDAVTDQRYVDGGKAYKSLVPTRSILVV